jgi:hypothetical protein
MNAKSWRRFWRELVRQRKPKLVLGEKPSVDFIQGKDSRWSYQPETRISVSRSDKLDRKREERTIRLMRVVRLLRREGWTVERRGALYVIRDDA